MSQSSEREKVVVFTGAGISAESGIQTFRDTDGLWNNYSINEVATPQAWNKNPQLVLDFYNARRENVCAARPNLAHEAVAKLEKNFDVVVVTQNVDDLHERAGSTHIIHLHGELSKARSSGLDDLIYDIGSKPINIGDICEKGYQLRPHIVWFGEGVQNYDTSLQQIKSAQKILVVGTSLSVYPAAGLLKKAKYHAEKLIVSLDIDKKPYGYKFIRGTAVNVVPHIVDCWLEGRKVK